MTRRLIALCLLMAATIAHAGPPWMMQWATVSSAYQWTTNDFVMTWAIPSTAAVTVPGRSGYTPSAQIYWQSTDAPLSVTAYNDADLTHSYAAAGTYQIIITGDWPAIYFNNGGNKTLIKSVDSWGTGANWDSIEYAFYGCSALTNCASPMPAMPNITSLYRTWNGCSSLTTAPDVSALTNVTTLSFTWFGCSSLTTAPDVSALTKATSLYQTWRECSSLTTAPDVSALTNVTNIRYTWYYCSSLATAPDVSALTNVTDIRSAWASCTGLTNAPDVSALTKVTSLSETWYYCSSLATAPDVSALTNVTDIRYTWFGCSSLTNAPDVSALTNVTDIRYTWNGCSSLTTAPDVSALTKATSLYQTWYGCSSLATVPTLPAASTALVETTSAFQNIGSGMTGTVVELWNTNLFPNITSYADTFTGCTGLDNYGDIPNSWKGL